MALRSETAAHCPKCNHHVDMAVYRTLEIDVQPNRDLVASDKVNTFRCPKCGFGPMRMGTPLLAINHAKHVAVWFEPTYDPSVDQDARAFAAQLGPDSFFAKAPRIRDWVEFKTKIMELEALSDLSPPTEAQIAALRERAEKSAGGTGSKR